MLARISQWLLIRPGEGRVLAYLAGLNLILGLGMALGRGSSDALFFKRFGVEYLPHMLFLTSLLLAVASMGYATIVDRLRPARLFNILFIAFCVYLAAVWAAMQADDGVLAFALYYVGYGVMSEILVVHFNFYALGFFDTQQAKRLFSVVSAAARLGAVLGGVALGLGSSSLAPENVALGWIATLALALWIVNRWHRGEAAPAAPAKKPHKRPWDDIREGLRFARGSPLLRVTALGMFVMILVISIQDYLASTLLTHHFNDAQSLAAFFGWFFAVTNGVVLILQLLVTNRLLRRFGLQTVNLVFPATSFLALLALTLSGGFATAVFARFNYMGLLPAFRIPAANLFYNALPAYMQGRARALLIGLVLPAGLACSGLLLMLVPPDAVDARLAAFGLVLAVIYLWLKMRKNRLYGESLLGVLQQQVFSGRPARLDGPGLLTPPVINGIKKLARESHDDAAILAIAQLLAENAPKKAGPFLLEIAPDAQPGPQNQLLQLLAKLRPPGWANYARRCLAHRDHHLRATALHLLAQTRQPGIRPIIETWLTSDSPRLKATAAQLAWQSDDAALRSRARASLDALLNAGEPGHRIAGIGVIEQTQDTGRLVRLHELTDAEESQVRASALRALGVLAPKAGLDLGEKLSAMARDVSPRVRSTVLAALPAAVDTKLRLSLLALALEDANHGVRLSAARFALAVLPQSAPECRLALQRNFDHFGMQSLLCRALAGSDKPGWRGMLMEIAERHVTTARAKHALRLSLSAPHPETPQGALAMILSEEVQQHVAQVLEIMVHLDEGAASRTVQAALASRNRYLRAQALESVRHLEHAEIFKHLLPLLEEELDENLASDVQRWTTHSWNDVLAWCKQEGSQWLAYCAQSTLLADPRPTAKDPHFSLNASR